jgi:phenylpropionate dioxygenase-like ring-hydroxylating dioxygenase large terminal subunit
MTLERPASFTALPREFYLDGPLFEAEVSRIWYEHWLYLAHASELPERGDFVVRELLGESILVVRSGEGEVTALLNVCRHRGARMVDGSCGRLKRIVCPYHHESLGLYRLALEIWNGFIFGCLGESRPAPLRPEIERLAPRLPEYAPERLRKVATKTYDCSANWKVMLENYLECYHCSANHPEFCLTADLRARSSEAYAEQALHDLPYWSMDVALRPGAYTASRTGGPVCPVPLSGSEDFTSGWSRSFGDWAAAAVLYFYADHAMVHQIDPVSATKTRFRLTWFVDEEARDGSFDVDDITHVWDMTTRQDVALIERAQAGLRSRRYVPGPLSSKHEPYIRSSLSIYLAAMDGDELVATMLERAGFV